MEYSHGVYTHPFYSSRFKNVFSPDSYARARAYLQENSKIKGAIEIHAFNVNRYDVLFVIKIPGRQARFSFCDVDEASKNRPAALFSILFRAVDVTEFRAPLDRD